MIDRGAIVSEALTWEDTPYHAQASVKGVGCDCKGLIVGVGREVGLEAADSAEAAFAAYGHRIDAPALKRALASLFDRVTEPEPGDVLLLKVGRPPKPQHLAIYLGDNRMIHCYVSGPSRVRATTMGKAWRKAVDSAWAWRDV